MSQYDARIVYIKGKENSMADALSCLPCEDAHDEAERHTQHPYSYCEDGPFHAQVPFTRHRSNWHMIHSGTSVSTKPTAHCAQHTIGLTCIKTLKRDTWHHAPNVNRINLLHQNPLDLFTHSQYQTNVGTQWQSILLAHSLRMMVIIAL